MKTFNLLVAIAIIIVVPYFWFSDAWTEPFNRYPEVIARFNNPAEWAFCGGITILLAALFLKFATPEKSEA